jgi:phosphoribosylformimino-5-aminoimidazole carboxamide ribotide isomerase
LYLADLDAIEGNVPALETYAALRSLDLRLWIDAGLRDAGMATSLAAAGIETIVAGLETLLGPHALEGICRSLGPERVVFSLDLRGEMPLADASDWRAPEPWSIAEHAIAVGASRLLILDLSRVGTHSGPGAIDLCRRLASKYPAIELAAGGGIRNLADVHELRQAGVRTALVASALHGGQLRREDLATL